ncbi:insulinase family protein, partial [bacterium]|nr:insulinase family protein [bacterium]
MKFWLTSCALLLGMTMMVNAQTPQVNESPDRSKKPAITAPAPVQIPSIQKYKLSNGIPVWMIVRDNAPLTTVAMLIKAGASKDPADKLGIASLAASMLDEGTEKYDSLSFAEKLNNMGTSIDVDPNYFCTTVSITMLNRNVSDCVEMLEEAVRYPVFPEKELDRVKGQRLTTFLQQREEPRALVGCAFNHQVFAGDPSNRQAVSIDGTAQSYNSITREDLLKFHKENYTPENISIAVTGNVNPEQILTVLEERFGSWKSCEQKGRVKTSEIKNKVSFVSNFLGKADRADSKIDKGDRGRTIYVVDRPGAPQSAIRVGCIGYERNNRNYFPLSVMNTALGGSFMSRLNQNLRERNGYTYGAGSVFSFRVEPGPFCVIVDVQADKTIPAVKEIFKELRAMKEPLPEDELDRTKKYICYGYPKSFETGSQLASRILEMQLYDLPDDYFSTYVDKVMSVDRKS